MVTGTAQSKDSHSTAMVTHRNLIGSRNLSGEVERRGEGCTHVAVFNGILQMEEEYFSQRSTSFGYQRGKMKNEKRIFRLRFLFLPLQLCRGRKIGLLVVWCGNSHLVVAMTLIKNFVKMKRRKLYLKVLRGRSKPCQKNWVVDARTNSSVPNRQIRLCSNE